MTSGPTTPVAPWLSLLLPVYNVEPWLRACVDSILSQEIDGVEIVMVDDVSTDGSRALAETIAAEHPGLVRVYAHDANRGISATRNTLLSQARGEYVWFVDSDDIVCPGAISRLRATVRETSPDLVLCDYRLVRSPFRLKHRLRGELHRRTFHGPERTLLRDRSQLVEGVLSQGQLHVWSKIARRGIWQRVEFPEGHFFEDIAAMAPLFSQSSSYIYVPEPWIGYRQRENSIMRDFTPEKLADLNKAVIELHRALESGTFDLSERARFAVDYFCLRTYASLARRLKRGLLAEHDGVRSLCHQSLHAVFPSGIDHVLAGYGRRGWHMRRLRARYYLKHMGWLSR